MKVTKINENIKGNITHFKVEVTECDEYGSIMDFISDG